MIYKNVQIYPEECCELCNDVIHNHIDCPKCGEKYAETESYHFLGEDGDDEEIECQNCKSRFKKVSDGSWYFNCDLELIEEI